MHRDACQKVIPWSRWVVARFLIAEARARTRDGSFGIYDVGRRLCRGSEWLFVGLWPRWLGCDPRPVRMGFVVEGMALGQVSLQVGEFYFFFSPSLSFSSSPYSFMSSRLYSVISCQRRQRVKDKGKGKAIPLQAWTGPEGSRRLRLPDFKTVGT